MAAEENEEDGKPQKDSRQQQPLKLRYSSFNYFRYCKLSISFSSGFW